MAKYLSAYPNLRSFPKIAVLCGAHTDLGLQVLIELLHSPEIDMVHAIASKEPSSLRRYSRTLGRKIKLHIYTSDKISLAFNKIPEADVAFCALGTERGAQNSIGMTRFRTQNYEAPSKFVRAMFELGVLYVGVLSHANANRDGKSELYRMRGELESSIKKLRKEAGEFSPCISLFKVENMVSHLSSSSSKKSRHAEDVEFAEVATAMRVDAVRKSTRKKLSDPKKRVKHEELDFQDIIDLALSAKEKGRELEENPLRYYY